MLPLLLFISFLLYTLSNSSPLPPNQCNESCGKLSVPFPFHLNTSCSSVSNVFNLSCSNSTTLYINIDSQTYRVLEFYSDAILVDFPGSSACRRYNDLKSFGFRGNSYFGISIDNVLGLYDCEDSSLCKAECETIDLSGCNGNADASPSCCYPLSDRSSWEFGDGFSVFSKFGCRGFASWAVSPGSNNGKRGVKLEWAIPRNLSKIACSNNANTFNATTVKGGVRCKCQDGFVGDGYAGGAGCLKSCIKNGLEANGTDCYTKRRSEKTVTILAGVLGPIFIIASLIALLCLMKKPGKSGGYDPNQAHFHSTISFRKACRTRLFSYEELEEATKGFEDGQKLVHSSNSGSIYAGVLGDGSHIAVHKVQCQDERDLMQVLSRIEILSAVLHRNMARLIGCCIDSGYTPLVVYDYPANGTLEEHLMQGKEQKVGLDWYKRLNIAAEIACMLAFLQFEIYPCVFHHNVQSSCIFLDEDSSVRIAGFRLLESKDSYRSDVYDFGVVLLELITGSDRKEVAAVALQKIKSGKIEEIVDQNLYYHEQPSTRKEQIQRVADVATRCVLFGGDGKIGMIEIARELVHITKESIDGGSRRGPALEETFSNSSLLQMISMSPDSIHLP
ncbi:probably inactive receptor-like protein kinase At2g46850 [Mercurialis annua]|uniref:probably inactive receptor-like protein kinase At2g46850 n=1 Tax=Mercurialis annua TaxID=3986 RepID=UPI002160B0E5|nr:probably inactive receptor-like protein kinase At2g46850 [Mercurialis annua]